MRNSDAYSLNYTVSLPEVDGSHPSPFRQSRALWMPGINPGMTVLWVSQIQNPHPVHCAARSAALLTRDRLKENATMRAVRLKHALNQHCITTNRNASGMTVSRPKKWGTIFQKGAPHLAIFPMVEPFSPGREGGQSKICGPSPAGENWSKGAPLFQTHRHKAGTGCRKITLAQSLRIDHAYATGINERLATSALARHIHPN